MVEQFYDAERLGQIVVGRKATGLRRRIFSGRYRRFDARSNRLVGDRAPASIRQADIAEDKVERLRDEQRGGVSHALGSCDLISIIQEDVLS